MSRKDPPRIDPHLLFDEILTGQNRERLKTTPQAPSKQVVDLVRRMPNLTPPRIAEVLLERGYRGQDPARKSMSLLAYRHVNRLKRIYLRSMAREELPPKSNALLLGPTGSGKTFLVELLFGEVLKLPTTIVDITTFTEAGYVGDDVVDIFCRLLQRANGDPELASLGVVAIDEFDKLAAGRNNARFAGEGTTKDVSGVGVQRGLLSILESRELSVPLEPGYGGRGQRVQLVTEDIPVIACGAFSGFMEAARGRTASDIGFGRQQRRRFQEGIATRFDPAAVQDIGNFQVYGFLPELIARFSRIVPFDPLGEDVLLEILEANVVSRYKAEFAAEGLELEVSPEVERHIARTCVKRETGARGLNALLTQYLEDAAYMAFGEAGHARVRLTMNAGEPKVEVS